MPYLHREKTTKHQFSNFFTTLYSVSHNSSSSSFMHLTVHIHPKLWTLSVACAVPQACIHTLLTPKVKPAGVQRPLWTPLPAFLTTDPPPRAVCCWGCTNSPAPRATPPRQRTKAAFTSTFWWPSEGNVVVAGRCLSDHRSPALYRCGCYVCLLSCGEECQVLGWMYMSVSCVRVQGEGPDVCSF